MEAQADSLLSPITTVTAADRSDSTTMLVIWILATYDVVGHLRCRRSYIVGGTNIVC